MAGLLYDLAQQYTKPISDHLQSQPFLYNLTGMEIHPVTLEGTYVRLEPLDLTHLDAMSQIGLDPELWRWTPSIVRTPGEMCKYIETALESQSRGAALPFATIDRTAGKVVGSTRFANIEKEHRRLEIGWTWIARPWQRTPINTEAKYLMLRHAFETLGCIRVEFKTDSLNRQSQAALERIGAKQEGVFRNHMITSSGRIRHSVYSSITDAEWPMVKAGLEEKLSRSYDRKGHRG
jgi:RimJ/RimL family protein N-acetyltransferase